MLPADFPYYFCGLPFRPYQVGRKLKWLLGLGERPRSGLASSWKYDSDAWHLSTKQQLKDETRHTELEGLGWHVISVRRTDVWGSYPALELAVGGFLCQEPRLPRRW